MLSKYQLAYLVFDVIDSVLGLTSSLILSRIVTLDVVVSVL